ncbi:RNase H superfamily protein [Lacibacter cauensis]|uniref:RNase H superfamily protein n=1 Tax=Lacibacter cauensis TaxID=510947 RepID=A0A562SH90_9BACT|nr:ribonuclease H-like domain-containing protein [Lacibacter cauensis]TWI80518.1 RNase H superfamily protein [Lacibacter cauensis]
MKDLYLDAEWFIGGEIFLLGWCRSATEFGQLYDDNLTHDEFDALLKRTTGIIYFYGPDIGIIEKHFDIDIRGRYHCVNLLKVFKDYMPGCKNYKLATMEKMFHIPRSRNEYKANIFSIFQDWRKPQVKSLVLQYNMEDVLNLYKLKEMIFILKDITANYLLQVRLNGPEEITAVQKDIFQKHSSFVLEVMKKVMHR